VASVRCNRSERQCHASQQRQAPTDEGPISRPEDKRQPWQNARASLPFTTIGLLEDKALQTKGILEIKYECRRSA
jgi:hypothetical protein